MTAYDRLRMIAKLRYLQSNRRRSDWCRYLTAADRLRRLKALNQL